MANTKQAKKRAAQSIRKRDRNRSVKTTTRGTVRELRAAAETGNAEKATALLPKTVSALDIAVRKGVLHKKTASRLKSRVTKATSKVAKKK
jgi:small subunit ribosomal protein S20